MKRIILYLFAGLVALSANAQTTPPVKLRSADVFQQVDNYLVAAKRLGIPSGPTLTLDATTGGANSAKLFWRTSDSTLHVYSPVSSSWLQVGSEGGAGIDTTQIGFGLSFDQTEQTLNWGEPLFDGAYYGVVTPENQPFVFGYTGTNSGFQIFNTSDLGNSGFLAVTNDQAVLNAKTGFGLSITPTAMLVEDAVNSRGLQYAADYSANYVARSLVDKSYVDRATGRSFSYTTDGSGTNDPIVVPHGLSYTPTVVLVTPNSFDAAAPFSHCEIDGSAVIIYPSTAGSWTPGTANLTWSIYVK